MNQHTGKGYPMQPNAKQRRSIFHFYPAATENLLALDYPKLVAHLVEAIKTLEARVATLETKQ